MLDVILYTRHADFHINAFLQNFIQHYQNQFCHDASYVSLCKYENIKANMRANLIIYNKIMPSLCYFNGLLIGKDRR